MAGCPFLRLEWCLHNLFKVSQGRLGLVGWQTVGGGVSRELLSSVTCWASSEPSLIIAGLLYLTPTHPLLCVLPCHWCETPRLCLRAGTQAELRLSLFRLPSDCAGLLPGLCRAALPHPGLASEGVRVLLWSVMCGDLQAGLNERGEISLSTHSWPEETEP